MSAWYIFSMMGFYPVNPCGDGYVLGDAQTDEVALHLPNGRTFRVGREMQIPGVMISHDDIMKGR